MRQNKSKWVKMGLRKGGWKGVLGCGGKTEPKLTRWGVVLIGGPE